MIIFSIVSAHAQLSTHCACAVKIDSTFQIAPMTLGIGTDVGTPPLYQNNNATTPAIQLPFDFCFYGHRYDSVFISNNGIISFLGPIFTFIDSTQQIPLGADTAIIAPFYADANTLNDMGVVYYKVTPTHMIVIWDSVRYAGTDVDGWNTFQLTITNGSDPILPSGNNVAFCYPIMQWCCSDSSGGFSGYGGTPAFVGTNKGDGQSYSQLGTFQLPGDYYYGPFSLYNGVEWLDFQYFYFNTCASHNLIAPYICNNLPDSNIVYICPCDTTGGDRALGAPDSLTGPCDTVNFIAQFICTEPGQTAVLSYTLTGVLNVISVYTSTTGLFDTIMVQAVPSFVDTGIHFLNLIATDTVNHLTSTVTYLIDVTFDCTSRPPLDTSIVDTTTTIDTTTTGIRALQAGEIFSIYPNPAAKSISISYDKGMGSTVVRMYGVLGEEVLSAGLTGGSSNIDVSGLARGMYFVELYRDGVPLSVKKLTLL
jgi:hypothetical protein